MDPQLGGSPLALDFATTWECQLGISGGMDPRLGGSPLAPVSATTQECQLGISGGRDSRFGGSPLAPISATTRECQLGILGGWVPDWGVLLSLPSPRPLGSANWAFWEDGSPIGGFSSRSRLHYHSGVPIGHFGRDGSPIGGFSSHSRIDQGFWFRGFLSI